MKILLTTEAFLKMQGFIDLSNEEISGIGKTRLEDGNVIVEDVILLKQVNTGTTSYIEEGADVEFLRELNARGESPEDWKLWWHSHADMKVFWSSTDTGTIESHMKKGVDGKNNGYDFFVSIVGNKKSEFKGRIDVSTLDSNFGIRGVETRDDVKIERIVEEDVLKKLKKIEEKKEKMENKIENILKDVVKLEEEIDSMLKVEEDEEILEQCKKEIKKYVIESKVKYYKSNKKYYDGYERYNRK